MEIINNFSKLIIPLFILFAVIYGIIKKVRLYDSFVTGAKDGIDVIIRIFPYVLAIFLVVKTFQASGAYDSLKLVFSGISTAFKIPPDIWSLAIIKPLSGSASIGIFTDTIKTTGPDSLASRISAVMLGSAETTFYVVAVYMGAVSIKKTKYLIPVCLVADIFGIIASIVIVKMMF
ncbi:MAG: nucleoside recognition domain-containing protein [Endomicrobiales bacterium]|jgi:spore maturation protein B